MIIRVEECLSERIQVQNHCYETVDLDDMVRVSQAN